MTADDTHLRALAEKRVRAKREFLMHATTYTLVNLALIAVWAVTG